MELLSGNEACAIGAIRAGVRFFAGYPITPSTEIAEYMAHELPKIGGIFIQMEDEIASICAMNGATAAGIKAMTATSGPGFSLMQEGIGYSCMTEVPCIIVNVMRGGPATGLPTRPAQGDIMQARWGTHGDHPIVALVPWSVAECFHLTVQAINISERLRLPVIILLDEIVGHMREVVSFPEKVDIYQPPKPTQGPDEFLLYGDDTNYDGPVVGFGEGYRIHLSGLTHRKDGFPTNDPKTIAWKMERLKNKIEHNKDWLWNFFYTDLGAETIIVCYGSTARSAFDAKKIYEKKSGKSIGIVRLCMIWPFPYERLTTLLRGAKKIIVPEMNQGQLSNEIERTVSPDVPVITVNRVDGEMLTPEEILNVLG
ncbi:MAG: 2-oxoacid:acceptor oxidoreductase subunit alpha [candidate division WOR-3 bacterium]|nr:2-oxoacid:acceptor oxidoreductase subunit alpha [candidate division WOR-3 bacterium]MDH5684204.1 2-oxoacid:acceptor oxidoreductase subunit alpha [candidate division WOR-3 bacterium]